MSKELGIFALPAIMFFKSGQKEPIIYAGELNVKKLFIRLFKKKFFFNSAGDLYEEEAILSWLLAQRNPSGDFIEDVEGIRLKHLIDESPSIAVYFCKTLSYTNISFPQPFILAPCRF